MDTAALFAPWLETQCRMISGTVRGVVWLRHGDGDSDLRLAACWPPDSGDASALLSQVQRAGNAGGDAFVMLLPPNHGNTPHHLVACPVRVGDQATGLVAIEVVQEDRARLESMLHLLQWSGAWLEWVARIQARQQDKGRALLLTMLAKLLGQHDPQSWVECLAGELQCLHVAVAWRVRGRWRLTALSSRRGFDPRSNASLSLAQEIGTRLEAPPERQQGARHIAVLKNAGGEVVGGLLLERPHGKVFLVQEHNWCAQLALYAGPILALECAARPGGLQRGLQVADATLRRLLGKGGYQFKLAIGASMLALALAALVPVDYRVSAPASLEGRVQRAVVAPRAGYVSSAPVRAGDQVNTGDTIAVLDSRELELEAEKWRNQRAQWQKAYRQALADHRRAEARIQRARVAQADAELALVEAQLARNILRTPIDGIVVSGDLSQSLGAPVNRGDVLFEVAPLDEYRVVVQVDDRDVAAVQPGQRGQLVLDALPGKQLAFTVSRITPVARVENGRNRFRIEGELAQNGLPLRPGMAGTGKIEAGRRSLLWILGHRTLDWLRLQAWALWF